MPLSPSSSAAWIDCLKCCCVGLQTSSAQGEGGSIVSRLRSSFVSRLRDTAAVNLANASLDPRDIAASGQAVVAGLSSPDARAAALESLVLDASPQETIRQLVRLCEVRTENKGAAPVGVAVPAGLQILQKGVSCMCASG